MCFMPAVLDGDGLGRERGGDGEQGQGKMFGHGFVLAQARYRKDKDEYRGPSLRQAQGQDDDFKSGVRR